VKRQRIISEELRAWFEVERLVKEIESSQWAIDHAQSSNDLQIARAHKNNLKRQSRAARRKALELRGT
jgi:hypothetical protein